MDKQLLAISLARYGVFDGYTHNLYLKKLVKKWDDPNDIASRCANLQINVNNHFMIFLLDITRILTVNCKHPKKYRDKTKDNVWYCMNCNSDL